MGDYAAKEETETIEGPELRSMLRSCELAVANLEDLGAGALNLLHTLDRVTEALEVLRERGMDVRSEETRLEGIQNILRRKISLLLRELRTVGGLASAREREDTRPPAIHWWWYLDLVYSKRQRARVQRYLKVAAIGVALVTLAVFAYRRFVPHDPILVAKMEHIGLAERHVEGGDVSAALAEYEAARAIDQSDPDILIWLGVLYERQERSREAQETFAEAERLVGDRATFLVMRGFNYGQLGDVEEALADGQDAVALNPDLAQAHLVMAGAYEVRGDARRAMEELEITAQLAQKDGNDSLYVIAKTRQAMLMQSSVAGMAPPEPTVER